MPRTLIISATQADCDVEPHLQCLINKFVDELKPWQALLYEDEGSASGDLWYAHWHAETGTLSTEVNGGDPVSIVVPGDADPVKELLPALKVLIRTFCE